MALFAKQRRTTFILMSVLLMTLLLALDMVPGTAAAQTVNLHRPTCSRAFVIQSVSCLPASVQAALGKRLLSYRLQQQRAATTKAKSKLTVVQVVVIDLTGNSQTSFVSGETVIYAAVVNNASTNQITATFNFTVQGTSTECNFNLTGNNLTVPTGKSTWETVSNLCGDETAGTYTLKVTVKDQNSKSNKGSKTGSFTVNQDDIGFPSIWNGQLCDTNQYANSFQLGTANYRGIPACGPRPLYDSPYKDVGTEQFVPGSEGEYEWECVELSMRFMYLTYGISPYNSPGGNDVVNNYPSGVNNILVPVPNNGTPGSLPVPGDVLSYTTTHTSVVLSTAVDGSTGNGTIYVLEENGSSSGIAKLTVQNWNISGVQNWLHHTLDLWPQTASPGTTILVSGEGFQPNETIYFYFDVYLYQTTADSNGNFGGTLTVPQLSSGTYVISAVGATTRPITQTVFYVP